jgi:hypothetical protein
MSENAFMPDRGPVPIETRANDNPDGMEIGPDGKGGTPPDFMPYPPLHTYGSASFPHRYADANLPHLDGTDAALSAAGRDYTGIDMLANHSVTIVRG